MSNVTVFTATPGGGKTQWILETVQKKQSEGFDCYILVTSPNSWRTFCEKYHTRFGEICKAVPVMPEDNDVGKSYKLTDCVFVDDALQYLYKTRSNKLVDAFNSSCNLFITMTGEIATNFDDSNIVESIDPRQLSFFD